MRSSGEDDVFYCRGCLSLKIFKLDGRGGVSYCGDCGGISIGSVGIDSWNKMYEKRYGHEYVRKDRTRKIGEGWSKKKVE